MAEPGASAQRQTPAQAVRAAVRRWGEDELIAACVDLVLSRSWRDQPELLRMVAPGSADALLAGKWGNPDYWPRTWALRTMLYAWRPMAEPAVLMGLADEHWRVREMAAQVVVRRELGAAVEAVARLVDDPVPRVRAAAARALGLVGEVEQAEALRVLAEDPESAVRQPAERALATLAERLDRDPDELRDGQPDR